MGDFRYPGRYVPENQDMLLVRNSYEHRGQKDRGHLRRDERKRYKRNKDRRRRRQKQWEEDIVKTGSEDENDVVISYRNRPRKGSYKLNKLKEEENSYVAIKERQDRLRRYMEQMAYMSPRDINDKGGGEKRRESVDHVRKIARERQRERENRKMKMTSVDEIPAHNYTHPGAIHNETKLPNNVRSRLNETSDSGGTSDEQFRDYTRQKRASILNRAEHLIRAMNNQSDPDSFSDQDYKTDSRITQLSNASNRTYVLKKEELDLSDDDDQTYVMVSTTVSPEPPDVELPFRPIPEYNGYRSRLSNKSIPSRIQVNIYL